MQNKSSISFSMYIRYKRARGNQIIKNFWSFGVRLLLKNTLLEGWKRISLNKHVFNRREDEIDKELLISGFSKNDSDASDTDMDDEHPQDESTDKITDHSEASDKESTNLQNETNEVNISKSPVDAHDLVNADVENKLSSLSIASAEECRRPKTDDYGRNSSVRKSSNLREELSDGESDLRSFSSMSTTSTIPPEVIHSKVKKFLGKRDSKITRQRCVAKGEASAVIRKRKENKSIVKEYTSSIWE